MHQPSSALGSAAWGSCKLQSFVFCSRVQGKTDLSGSVTSTAMSIPRCWVSGSTRVLCRQCQRNVPIKCSMETAPVEKAAACWHRGSCCAFATRVQCWLMVSLVATRSPRSFPAELHLSESGPLWTCARDYSCLGAELGVPCYWTA